MIALFLLLAAAQADPILEAARARYEEVAYDEALAILEKALPELSDDAERARVQAFAGLVRAQMGDEAGARASFDQALALDACVGFPDAAAPPRIHAIFAAIKAARAPVTPAAAPVAPAATPVEGVGWPVPAGLAFAAAGAASLAAGAIVGGLAFSTSAQANAAVVQLDAVALDTVAREQALVANSLAIFGTALVLGGAATAGVGLALE